MRTNEIFEYVRDKSNRRIGVFYAKKQIRDGHAVVYIGYSKYNKNHEYVQFNKNYGVFLARERAIKGRLPSENLPFLINENLSKFKNRCKRYFKTDNVFIH